MLSNSTGKGGNPWSVESSDTFSRPAQSISRWASSPRSSSTSSATSPSPWYSTYTLVCTGVIVTRLSKWTFWDNLDISQRVGKCFLVSILKNSRMLFGPSWKPSSWSLDTLPWHSSAERWSTISSSKGSVPLLAAQKKAFGAERITSFAEIR